jgi:hypothetical protein
MKSRTSSPLHKKLRRTAPSSAAELALAEQVEPISTTSTTTSSTTTTTTSIVPSIATTVSDSTPSFLQGTSDLVALRDASEGSNSLKVKIFSSTKFFPEFELEFECTHTTGLPTNFKPNKKLGFHREQRHATGGGGGGGSSSSSSSSSSSRSPRTPKQKQKDNLEFVSCCDECGSEPSAEHDTWVCLHCSSSLCGRDSINKHMELHNKEHHSHCISLSLTDGSFWCYKCQRYLEHKFYPELQHFYRRFHKEKFGQRPENDRTPPARTTSVMKACAHCDQLSPIGFKSTLPFQAMGCSVCHSKDEDNGLWVCLCCDQVFCGRFDSGGGKHGVEHWKQTGHSVTMSLKDGSIWCYFCGEHQDHSMNANLSAFYAAFHVARHSEVPPLRSLKRQNSVLVGSSLTEDETSLLSTFNAAEFRWSQSQLSEEEEEAAEEVEEVKEVKEVKT